jgi:hypothetical protein
MPLTPDASIWDILATFAINGVLLWPILAWLRRRHRREQRDDERFEAQRNGRRREPRL